MYCCSPIQGRTSLKVSNLEDKSVPYFKKKKDHSSWIGEQLCKKMDFIQFYMNADKCVIPGKLSKIHFQA